MSNFDYKLEHEAFMQNNNGTTALDTFTTILPTFLITCIIKQVIISYSITNYYCKLYLEFIVLVVPIILSTTVAVNSRGLLLLICAFIFCCVYYKGIINVRNLWCLKVQNRKEWYCISQFRALTFLITVYCILAVDFNIFPRFLAKTEKYGYSLMDIGVGLFITCNAIVSPKISKYGILKSIEQNLKPCIVLIIIGYVRMMLVSEINYHQHITEYGLHWNFFFTLAFTKFFATCILHIFKEDNSLICGIVLMCLHEIILFKGLRDYVFSDIPRDNFFSANREGLASCLGYLSMYLISTFIGQTIREKYYYNSEGQVLNTLFSCILPLWIISYLSNKYLGTSRCLANMGYCTYTLSVGSTILIFFYMYDLNEISMRTERYLKDKMYNYQMPIILSAINKNGLLFFLIGNMVTGLINLLFQTIHLNTFISLTIIFLYMVFVVMGIVGWENKKGLKQ